MNARTPTILHDVCGPVPLRERMSRPEAALAIATGDTARGMAGSG